MPCHGACRRHRARREQAAGYAPWRETQVLPQRQDGYFTVEISPRLGITDAAQLTALAGIIEQYGEQMLRVTNWQGALLRQVAEGQLPALHAALSAIGLGAGQTALLRHMVTCAGAATCRLGICLSRGLAGAIAAKLTTSGVELSGDAGDLSLHISGCPNACGRHPLAQIGWYGAARRVGERLVPHYVLVLGGHVEEGGTVLASGSLAIPARHIPTFLLDFLQAFRAAPRYPDFAAFLATGGVQVAEEIAPAIPGGA